jgi:fatty acid desaturase
VNPDDEERRRIVQSIRHKAVARMRAKLGLYWHATAFVMANTAMIAINLIYSPEARWFVWPLAGWGLGLVMHAFATLQTGDVSEAMVQAEIQRELQKRGLV